MSRKTQTYITSPIKPTTSTLIELPERESMPFSQRRIMFSIECCGDKYCYNKIKDKRERIDFADRLHELSQLTWGTIKNKTNRQAFGYEKLDHITVKQGRKPDGANLIGFIYHDNHRMIGYQDPYGVFHILEFDYKGKRYKH